MPPETSTEPPSRRNGPTTGAHPVRVVAVLATLLTVLALSLLVGANPLPPGDVLDALLGNGTLETDYIVWEQRIPRTVAGLLVGAALGVAGALIQAFTRNPLADPGILGVNAGAAFFVAIGVAFFGMQSIGDYTWLAFAGALVLTFAVYLIGSSGRGPADPVRLTLTGVALGAVLSGLTTGLTLTDPDAFEQMRGWAAGSLVGRNFDILVPVLPFLAAGLLLALLVAPALNSVALGEDLARAQGVPLGRVRLGVLAAVTLLAGTATAVAGPISFVGLMVPHVLRWTVGPDQRRIVAGSAVAAPVLVLGADIVGRVAVLPSEMPAGVVTAFIGAPVLIVLVRRRKASAL